MNLKTTLLAALVLSAALSALTVRAGDLFSGYTLLKEESRQMQDDDFMNPGMDAVAKGAAMFAAPGRNGATCAGCHGEGGKKLDPKRLARYPAIDAKTRRPVTLQQRLIDEWRERLGNAPLKYESDEALALEAFTRSLARGQVVDVQTDGDMAPYYQRGKALFEARGGQYNMACNLCHDDHPGQKLRAQVLSQGQTNGFPLYRLEGGKVVGAQSRINQCNKSVRAEQQPYGTEDFALMELYMNARGNGLKIETPAVRF